MANSILPYEDFVALVINALDAAGIDYMVGGAVAVWAWGEPRATIDLDLVVKIDLDVVEMLSKELEKRNMLVPADVILDSLLETRMDLPINAIHLTSGYKADLYPMRKGDDLRISAFQRKRMIDLGEPLGKLNFHSPEDLIIYKLWYFSLSQQTKHTRDITSIVRTLANELDLGYIAYWVGKKGLTGIWDELLGNINRTF